MTPPIRRLIGHATPVLRRFARDAEQAVHLVIHDRSILVVIAQVDSPGYWNVSVRIGPRIGVVDTGSGHIFLAFASEEDRAFMLEDLSGRPHQALPPLLLNRLAEVREQGWESMKSQQVSGVTNLSVPIFGPRRTVVAALTCPYADRLDTKHAPGRDVAMRLPIAAGQEISTRSAMPGE